MLLLGLIPLPVESAVEGRGEAYLVWCDDDYDTPCLRVTTEALFSSSASSHHDGLQVWIEFSLRSGKNAVLGMDFPPADGPVESRALRVVYREVDREGNRVYTALGLTGKAEITDRVPMEGGEALAGSFEFELGDPGADGELDTDDDRRRWIREGSFETDPPPQRRRPPVMHPPHREPEVYDEPEVVVDCYGNPIEGEEDWGEEEEAEWEDEEGGCGGDPVEEDEGGYEESDSCEGDSVSGEDDGYDGSGSGGCEGDSDSGSSSSDSGGCEGDVESEGGPECSVAASRVQRRRARTAGRVLRFMIPHLMVLLFIGMMRRRDGRR